MSMIPMPPYGRKPMAPWAAGLVRAAAVVHRHVWWTRAMTLGVRAIVFDEAARVLLVRHTYRPGWYLPGGGVDPGESVEVAVIRELREEGAMACQERPALLGLYRQQNLKRDHVACFVIHRATPIPDLRPDWEIAETGFFATDALPEHTTRATRARLDEVLHGAPIAEDW